MLVKPHGHSELNPRLVEEAQRPDHLAEAKTLRSVSMTSRELSDLLMFGMGAYSPLNGFMGEESWRKCCTNLTTDQGLFWPIPITMSVPDDVASSISIGQKVALTDENGTIYGTLEVDEKYSIDKELECREVYRTVDPKHPGVEKVMAQAPVNLSGSVTVLNEGVYPSTYKGLYLKPEETRAIFEKNNWSTVAAFQTRNPMHRSHEHLAKIAIEICDGLLIHQVLGALKPGDIPADIRVAAIDALVENYFVPGTAIQAGYPIEMRYAGPREALLHALFRQNFGCSHLVVGRDHAGVGDYYGPFDAHHIFDEIPKGSLETQPLKIDIAFYSYKCGGMATGRTCPSDESQRLNISGTRLREMLANGEPVPEEFSRPEVIDVLRRHYDA
tara:strand:- start:35 stop:1192 length:1158 start_codon:yes stop_codon:yes gene_type:complete